MAALQTACGVPVVGMDSPRGIADPRLGAFAQVLAQADCVLLLGKRLDFTLKFGQAPALGATAVVHQVDAEPAEFERSRAALGARLALDRGGRCRLGDGSARRGGRAERRPRRLARRGRGAIAWRPPEWERARCGAVRAAAPGADAAAAAGAARQPSRRGAGLRRRRDRPVGQRLPRRAAPRHQRRRRRHRRRAAVRARRALRGRRGAGGRGDGRRHGRLSHRRVRHRGALRPAVRRRGRQRRALERRVPDPAARLRRRPPGRLRTAAEPLRRGRAGLRRPWRVRDRPGGDGARRSSARRRAGCRPAST